MLSSGLVYLLKIIPNATVLGQVKLFYFFFNCCLSFTLSFFSETLFLLSSLSETLVSLALSLIHPLLPPSLEQIYLHSPSQGAPDCADQRHRFKGLWVWVPGVGLWWLCDYGGCDLWVFVVGLWWL